ncbi:ParB/RepB/Spo0J family partition protein, partial [Bacillus sp. B15-48]|uniref:ParB/RepB/Spo0J family partition protein n=1 Tax=Bacillus sp. B15-48 TaxID=1548601 RepID=UPI00193EED7C
NGRIATHISKYIDEHGSFNFEDLEAYNNIVHDFIVNSNKQALRDTKNNIKLFGQRLPGVVLKNGRIVDGNRRFTCLRELNKDEGKDYYFEAVILDTDQGISAKDVKRLELNLQHAEEKPVDYNPIDNLVDVYRDLVENKIFTVQEYATNTNKKEKEVEKLKTEAMLMVEFLDFINAKGKYYIARDLKLDGPFQEIMSILKSVSDDQREDVKNTLFAALITSNQGDLTRFIRNIGKDIIKTSRASEFMDEYEDITAELHDALHEQEITDVNSIGRVIASNQELKDESNKIIEKKIDASRTDAARNKPVDLLSRAFDTLDAIDSVAVSLMKNGNKEEFKEILKKVQSTIDLLEEKVNV